MDILLLCASGVTVEQLKKYIEEQIDLLNKDSVRLVIHLFSAAKLCLGGSEQVESGVSRAFHSTLTFNRYSVEVFV
jgi:hypothetical protein